MLLSIFIAIMGFVLAKRLVDPVIDMALEARVIASGDFGRKIEAKREDEIGDLGRSINLITKKIKDSLGELENYSVRTKQVNIEIQRKVLALSGLLQIGDSIASMEDIAKVLHLIVEKVSEIGEDNFAVIFMAESGTLNIVPKASFNISPNTIKDLSFTIGKGYVGTFVKERWTAKVDSSTKFSPQLGEVCNLFNTKNCFILPVVCHGIGVGFMITGNQKESYKFKDDDIELMKVLNKQLGIAVESDILVRRTKDLVIKDELTNLYNDKYIRERLDEEIKRSILYQRPCSLLLFNVDNFKLFRERHGEMITEGVLKKIASTLKESAMGVSKVARLGADEFAIILPEKNKREAANMAEEIRKKIEDIEFKGIKKKEKSITISGSVSENPIDGASSKELFNKAKEALKRAKQEGKNKIAL